MNRLVLYGRLAYDPARIPRRIRPSRALRAQQVEPAQQRVGVGVSPAELSPVGMAKAGWDNVVYDGDLGDLPVFLVAPRDLSEAEFQQVWAFLAEDAGKQRHPEEVEKRARRFYLTSRERYRATSTKCERIYTPEGTTHYFAYEAPEFVADVVRKIVSYGSTA